MSPHQIRRICQWSSAGLLVVSGGWLTDCLRTEVEIRPEFAPETALKISAKENGQPLAEPTAGDFALVWNKRLRRPLIDLPASPTTTNVPAVPLNVNLLGTIVEPGRSAVLVTSAAGQIELKHIGEQIGNAARLEEVYADRAVLLYQNRRVEILLPPPKDRP